jgi:NitT/TauT family transport system substrate-binding protein
LALLLALFAAGGVGVGAWMESRRRPVVVPVSSWPGYEYMSLAAHQGLDRAQGIRIEPRRYRDSQLIVQDLAWGRLQVAQLTTVELVDLCARLPQRCPVVVLVVNASHGADQLLLAADVPNLAALKGQVVAVSPSTLGPFLVQQALERVGLRLSDVTLRNVALEAMPAGFARGAIQAAAMYPPFSAWALRTGKARVAFDSSAIPGQILDVLVVDSSFLASNPAVVARLLRAWHAAHAYARREPRTAHAWLAAQQGLSLAEFGSVQRGLVYQPLQEQVTLLAPGGAMEQNLRAVQRVQARVGLVPVNQALPPVSNGPLRQALQRP